ncbi:MAG: carboxypeptidase-like regulatory domain-containing protein [Arenimonas sp.]
MRYLIAIALLFLCSSSQAQSGRATLRGWVNFQDVAYVDKQPVATVRLRQEAKPNASYDAKTDEHGFYDFNVPSMGRFQLTISAEGFETYATELYLSSDVMANWPIQLKASAHRK